MSPELWREIGSEREVAGHRLFYVDSGGEGPLILLLHGFPTSSWDWHKLWPRLTLNFRCLAPDFLGFGFSDKPRRHRYSIKEQADLVEALVRELGLGPHHVLAHDYGDTVAQELLARDNQRPRGRRQICSVCFLNGGLFPETHRARPIQKMLHSPVGPLVNALAGRRSFARSFARVFGPKTRPGRAELAAFWQVITHNRGKQVFHKLIGYMAERRHNRARWVGALQDAHCPVQLINGSADPVSGAHMVGRYKKIVRDDDPVTALAEIGHYPQWEAPDAVLEAYLAFLQAQQLPQAGRA